MVEAARASATAASSAGGPTATRRVGAAGGQWAGSCAVAFPSSLRSSTRTRACDRRGGEARACERQQQKKAPLPGLLPASLGLEACVAYRGRAAAQDERRLRYFFIELVVVVGVRLDLLYLVRCGGRRRHHSSGRWLPGRRRHHLRLLRRRGRRRGRGRRRRRGLRYLGGRRPLARTGRGGGSTEAPSGERQRHRRGVGVTRGGELCPAELHVQLPEHELVPRRCRLRQQVGQSQRDLQCTQCSTVHAERHGSAAALRRECAGLMRAPKRAAQAHAALGSRVRPKPAAISSSL